MVCGTFFALGNMDNHFLHIFSNLETLIRSISPGGAGGPLLPTRLYIPHRYMRSVETVEQQQKQQSISPI